jgi:hypothetical protein
MSELPIERLNYYDGQRLQASDFKLEQEFHIRTQRWLTKSLFTPGIADGLEISISPNAKSQVIVSEGMAIDDLGRAIILVAPQTLPVCGPFLTIRYDEQKTAAEQDTCGPAKAGGQTMTWGGPARILSAPVFAWRDAIPSDSTRELVLAQLVIKANCEVQQILVGSRRYAGAAQTDPVKTITLEGEKDLVATAPDPNDATKPPPLRGDAKLLYFNIRGGRPNSVSLYLRGDVVSQIHYSELGSHTHQVTLNNSLSAVTQPASGIDSHTHATGTLRTDLTQDTCLLSPTPSPPFALLTGAGNFAPGAGLRPLSQFLPASLPIVNSTGDVVQPGPAPTHTHHLTGTVTIGEVFNAGASSVPGSVPGVPWSVVATASSDGQAALSYFTGLQIWIGGSYSTAIDVTDKVVAQIQANHPEQHWLGTLGNGTSAHPIVEAGTGEIRLDLLEGIDISSGEYVILMWLNSTIDGAHRGGKVIYSLYVQ